MLNWSRSDLAEAAGLSLPVIVKFEGGGNIRAETLAKIHAAFSQHGITFTSRGAVQTIKHRR